MSESGTHSKRLFWGCFIALITTGFGFIGRIFLLNEWGAEFKLDPAQLGILGGIGIWPFAVSIILFSLFIDKIGYKTAMIFAFIGHLVWAVLGVAAYFVSKGGDTDTAYKMLVVGSLILALGNGSVEAFINPVVATLFSKEKTKWLNILHAAWPGGLVIAGLILIFMGKADWYLKVGVIAIPAVVYFIMLIKEKFPVSERVSSGVSYKEMLGEFGAFGAMVAGTLLSLQIVVFLKETELWEVTYQKAWIVAVIVGLISAIAMGVYTKSAGRGLMAFLLIIMMPLAITEIGTDGWITAVLEDFAKSNKFHPGLVLVYTSAIMLVLRFFAGPIIKVFSPLGLLLTCGLLAVAGLMWLSTAQAFALVGAATLYGIGKTFFWPTMLGVVSEQMPKGGALTLNSISGIGMLAAGAIGSPLLGVFQIDTEKTKLAEDEFITRNVPAISTSVTEKDGLFGKYTVVDDEAIAAAISKIPDKETGKKVQAAVEEVASLSPKWSLSKIAIFPAFMTVCFLILFLYFRSKGGYKPIDLTVGGGEH